MGNSDENKYFLALAHRVLYALYLKSLLISPIANEVDAAVIITLHM